MEGDRLSRVLDRLPDIPREYRHVKCISANPRSERRDAETIGDILEGHARDGQESARRDGEADPLDGHAVGGSIVRDRRLGERDARIGTALQRSRHTARPRRTKARTVRERVMGQCRRRVDIPRKVDINVARTCGDTLYRERCSVTSATDRIGPPHLIATHRKFIEEGARIDAVVADIAESRTEGEGIGRGRRESDRRLDMDTIREGVIEGLDGDTCPARERVQGNIRARDRGGVDGTAESEGDIREVVLLRCPRDIERDLRRHVVARREGESGLCRERAAVYRTDTAADGEPIRRPRRERPRADIEDTRREWVIIRKGEGNRAADDAPRATQADEGHPRRGHRARVERPTKDHLYLSIAGDVGRAHEGLGPSDRESLRCGTRRRGTVVALRRKSYDMSASARRGDIPRETEPLVALDIRREYHLIGPREVELARRGEGNIGLCYPRGGPSRVDEGSGDAITCVVLECDIVRRHRRGLEHLVKVRPKGES